MRFALALILLTVLNGGCKSATQRQLEAEQTVFAPPMDLDPTQHIEIGRWWSNGTHLLRLDDSNAYALHEGVNRYARPIEIGRWSKLNYAALWLEPYTTATVQPRRVEITRVNGNIALLLPLPEGPAIGGVTQKQMKPMFALPAGPPQVLEDRMLGRWEGPLGTLQLGSDLRFALTPTSDEQVAASVPRIRAMTRGAWRIERSELVLESDVPGMDLLRLPLEVANDHVTIRAPGGAMNKAESSP